VVMVLQRFEGCSDREAVDRFAFDARWKYAAGGLSFDYPSFVHTVLVDMRARLRASERPDRIFETVLETAKAAGLVGCRRVLDSTSLYDAVATMDTVTLIRSAIRGQLAASATDLEGELRGLLARDDDYAAAGKPVCDYEDRQAREELIDALAKDAHALLVGLGDPASERPPERRHEAVGRRQLQRQRRHDPRRPRTLEARAQRAEPGQCRDQRRPDDDHSHQPAQPPHDTSTVERRRRVLGDHDRFVHRRAEL
jgi:Transposase domain (DUF772)